MKRAIYGLLMALAVGLVVALALSWGRREEMGRPPPSDVAPISSAAADPFEADLENWRPSSIRQVVDPRYPDEGIFLVNVEIVSVSQSAFVGRTGDNRYLTISLGSDTLFYRRMASQTDQIEADSAALEPGGIARIGWRQGSPHLSPKAKPVASWVVISDD